MSRLYIPVESQSRELASRIAVALYSLDIGFSDVIIGRDVEVFNTIQKPGVVLLKSAASFEFKLVEKLLSQGHKVYSLDEEGILPPLNDSSINTRFSKDLLSMLSGVFVNGNLELSSFPSWVKSSEKLIITGNPRFDFYAPRKRRFYNNNKNKINSLVKGKKIILLVSRFGDVNLSKNINYFKLLEDNGYMNTEKSRAFHKGFYEHSKVIFEEFIQLPTTLAREFPEHMIVVRPHPSECDSVWRTFNKFENILVSSQFDIASWLSCAEVMVHNGCTTSVEATAMEVPVISFVPATSDEYDLVQANELGEKAENIQEVVDIIRDKEGLYLMADNLSKLNEIIKYDPECNASELIAKSLYDGVQTVTNETNSKRSKNIRFFLREIIKLLLSNLKLRHCYARKKYPFISTVKFRAKVEDISKCMNLEGFSVNREGIDVFRIKKIKPDYIAALGEVVGKCRPLFP
ncbi:hypothetical protein RS130_21420 [Paraglaciecola aquimarina]|uniref:Surface carbohydrate biosynthesis protein n=1 Tax=Paraglaciecola aquimarina TaxID=1235557 RepID=A0ABU3T1F1_9ALTE|nr:surface carbohydrate biosynthesis protein [Paraglaciecola aquimarina]MDU0356109.1 hypothetical protein [Paraglaciecola aquimarina]